MIEARLALPADLPAVFAVRHAVFIDEQAVPVDLERDDLDAEATHAIGSYDGAPVAAGRVVIGDDGVAVVGRMAVLAEARGAGAGAAVLGVLEQAARAAGVREVVLHAQQHAVGFYQRAGYHVEGKPYLEAGIVHVDMRKRLPVT